MKSKIFIFTTLILVVFLFVITSCNYFLNGNNNTTININLDLSKIVKTSRNVTASNSTEYILKVFAYNAASYKPKDEIENLPLLTQTENKVDVNGNVKARLDVTIGLNVIFVAKLYQGEAEEPIYAGKSEVIKIKTTNNKVHLVLTRENAIPAGFVFVKGTTITGTESWTPSSEVFVRGRKLTIPDLIVSDHEVTRGEYKAVMESDPSTAYAYDEDGNKLEGDDVLNNPVNEVSWYDALVYCNKRSIDEGFTPCYTIKGATDPVAWGPVPTASYDIWNAATCDFNANGYRLPTNAEWEWLARGGENYLCAGSNNPDEVAWYTDNTNGTREVKTKAPNGYGLYDMSGNVSEWCWDWYRIISDSTPADGATSGTYRVFRGGGWYSDNSCQVTSSGNNYPHYNYDFYGFRVVRTATEVIDHTHTFSTDWTSDGTYHWHAATCEDTTEVSEKGEHTYTNGICVCGMREMVLIPAGTFQMGSTKGNSNTTPVHEVTITKSFYMGKYEVTQAEYEKYCSYTGSKSPSSSYGDGDNYPAYYVSWYDALVYCNKRSMAEGLTPCYSISDSTDPKDWGAVPSSEDATWDSVICDWNANGYRLPTEAEREYAARARDNTVDSLTYSGTSDVNKLGDYAWYSDSANDNTHEVGTKLSNAFGLYDMSGNVWEWCWNIYTDSYNTTTEGGNDPTGVSVGSNRVIRGGGWNKESGYCSVSCRGYTDGPYFCGNILGFRVVRTATE